MIRNVYFVLTPLQLLNALEARAALDTSGDALVIVTAGHARQHIDALVEPEAWDEVYGFDVLAPDGTRGQRLGRLRRTYQVRRALDGLARSWGAVEGLFLGNYGNALARHVAATLDHRTLYLLDDGTDTIKIAEQRAGRGTPDLSWDRAWRVALRDRALGLRTHEAERLVFFTTYDLPNGHRDSVIRNTYARLRERAARPALDDEVLFLGQPLVEDRLMRAEWYTAYVAAARAASGDRDFVYAPHKRESPERVDDLADRLGMQVRRADLPVEVEFARSGRLPSVLASFFCSALDNCRLMYGDAGMEIVAFRIEGDHLLLNRRFVASVYEYLAERQGPGFRVAPLQPALEDG
jgi:hypothetical protein